jgi:integrase
MTRKTPGVRQLGTRSWEINVSAGVDPAKTAVAGRTVYRRVYRRVEGTLTDAKNARQQLAVEARQGRYGGTDATVDELLDAWLRELERIGRAPSTIASYRKIAAAHVRPILGPVKARDITVRQLADHLASMTEGGLAPNSVRLVHACLSSAFSQAARWEWVDKDPTKLVRGPSLQNKRPVIPTTDDVARLLAGAERCGRSEMAAAIWLAATTGVRRGELCGLRISDFDLERGRMQIERALSGETVWTTKNRRWREVALDPATVLVVGRHIETMRRRAEAAGCRFQDDGYLFTDTATGDQPWNPHTVTDAFRRLSSQCYRQGCKHGPDDKCETLAHITFHSLRKFMESRALDAGFSIAEVAHRAGHDPAVLMRFYAGAVEESGGRLAEAVASLLPSPGAVAQSVRAAHS